MTPVQKQLLERLFATHLGKGWKDDPILFLDGWQTVEAPTLPGPLDDLEVVLITNYRAASAEGQEALRRQAAFFAGNSTPNRKAKK